VNLEHLRSHIGIVSQEPVLFATTIANNIMYGTNKDVSMDDVARVAEMANAHSFVSKLPRGYDTVVGERGVQLSGGQKQRIAIARMLIRECVALMCDLDVSHSFAARRFCFLMRRPVLSTPRAKALFRRRLTKPRRVERASLLHTGSPPFATQTALSSWTPAGWAFCCYRFLNADF
jgi:ATP-binding cassette, subfamily B (MDR/TAP), member 1